VLYGGIGIGATFMRGPSSLGLELLVGASTATAFLVLAVGAKNSRWAGRWGEAPLPGGAVVERFPRSIRLEWRRLVEFGLLSVIVATDERYASTTAGIAIGVMVGETLRRWAAPDETRAIHRVRFVELGVWTRPRTFVEVRGQRSKPICEKENAPTRSGQDSRS
jgi:hypothetical protein